MVTQWERFEQRSGQTIRDLGGEQAIEITNGTATHTAGEGWDYSYPNTPTATLDAETRAPSAATGIEDSGTFEEIDQLAFVSPLVGDRTYTSDTTIPEGEIETFDTVTVAAGVTLTVEGRLQTNQLTVDGTVVGDGTVAVYEGLFDSITPYGVAQEPPTRVTVLENGTTYEVKSSVKQGDGYTRLDLVELDS